MFLGFKIFRFVGFSVFGVWSFLVFRVQCREFPMWTDSAPSQPVLRQDGERRSPHPHPQNPVSKGCLYREPYKKVPFFS